MKGTNARHNRSTAGQTRDNRGSHRDHSPRLLFHNIQSNIIIDKEEVGGLKGVYDILI